MLKLVDSIRALVVDHIGGDQVDKLEDFEVDNTVVAVATVLVGLGRTPAASDIAGLVAVVAEQLLFAVAVVVADCHRHNTFYTKSSSQSREAVGKDNLKMEV